MSRPGLQEIHEYRDHVDRAISAVLERTPISDEILDLIELGLNHEQQHQELIVTDIKHALWAAPIPPEAAGETHAKSVAPQSSWIQFEGGIHSVGHAGTVSHSTTKVRGTKSCCVRFKSLLAATIVEHMKFMGHGGYNRPELWLSDGWDTVRANDWDAPLYWESGDNGSWLQFDGSRIKPLDGRNRSAM